MNITTRSIAQGFVALSFFFSTLPMMFDVCLLTVQCTSPILLQLTDWLLLNFAS